MADTTENPVALGSANRVRASILGGNDDQYNVRLEDHNAHRSPHYMPSELECWRRQFYELVQDAGIAKTTDLRHPRHHTYCETDLGVIAHGSNMNQKKKKPRDFGTSRWANIVVLERANLYVKGSKNASKESSKTHCVNDHPWNNKSTYNNKHGRNFRICNAVAARRYLHRVKRRVVPE